MNKRDEQLIAIGGLLAAAAIVAALMDDGASPVTLGAIGALYLWHVWNGMRTMRRPKQTRWHYHVAAQVPLADGSTAIYDATFSASQPVHQGDTLKRMRTSITENVETDGFVPRPGSATSITSITLLAVE